MQHDVSALGLDWDAVRLFLALGRAQTVGQAARTLGVDASTVSRRLAVLEATLGVTLFERGRSGLSITQAAESLLPAAEEVEERMTHFVGVAEGQERAATGLVRIACPPDVAEVVLAPLLPTLRARHPGVRLEIEPGEAVLDLSRREADLALRTVRPVRGDLIVTRLAEVDWILVASAALAAELGALRRWDDAPWIGWSERLAHVPAARWLATAAPTVEPVVRTGSLTLQLALVRSGIGVALVPRPSAVHFGFVEVKLSRALRASALPPPTDSLYLVTHAALRNVARVRAVWELVSESQSAAAAGGRLARKTHSTRSPSRAKTAPSRAASSQVSKPKARTPV